MNETLNYQRAYPMITNNEFEQDDSWHQEIYKKYGYESRHKTPTYFGPYLLLQTLGEGEFAKVKAGVHVETEQDVSKLERICK
jgi:hypothetical protein